jgi:hypothetical protein
MRCGVRRRAALPTWRPLRDPPPACARAHEGRARTRRRLAARARAAARRGVYRIKYADGDREDMSASEVERTLRNMGQEGQGQGRRGQGQLALRACKPPRGGAPPAAAKKARVV